MTAGPLTHHAPRLIWPARRVHSLGELAAAERLELFDAIHAALEQRPGATVAMRQSAAGLFWEIVPAARSLLTTGARHDHFLNQLLHPLARATHIDILASFVMHSGVSLIEEHLRSALQRGAMIRVMTGDYLEITHAHALRNLLDLELESGRGDEEDQLGYPGRLSLRVITQPMLRQHARTFHPKAWIVREGANGVAFVGSSNLSRAALTDGLEWNLGIERSHDPAGFMRVLGAYDELWQWGQQPTQTWLDEYQERQRRRARGSVRPLPAAEPEPEEEHELPPAPRAAQIEALEALERARQAGQRRALVVMATGMGKTWLAAFDVQQMVRGIEAPRVLVVAHRVELLRQTARTFRALFPEWRFGWCVGDRGVLEGELVLASVQKLGRMTLSARRFDYVIIDEVHHALAPGYVRLIEQLDATFLLGLTATPERADGGDLRALFDGNVPFEATLKDGITQGALAPLRYHGLKDTIDYEPLPWRGGRFDLAALEAAAQTVERMERLWEALGVHEGSRTLVFCCSIAHATFVAAWLRGRGWRVACVHSGPESDDRVAALEQIGAGELDAICVVDLFNEGVDVPAIDRVVMLRPTESPVIFLQQLGRGLRVWPGKSHLTIIDLVGNHRVFLERLRILCDAVGEGAQTMRAAMRAGGADEPVGLPPGCFITLELEAIELLRELWPSESDLAMVRAYRQLAMRRATRPQAMDLYVRGYNPLALRRRGGWLQFVEDEGGLSEEESAALARDRAWFQALEAWRWREPGALDTLESWIEDAEQGRVTGAHEAMRGELPLDETQRSSLLQLTREVVDALIAGRSAELSGDLFTGAVEADPSTIIFDRSPGVSSLVVRLADGAAWRLVFDGARCTSAHTSGGAGALDELLAALGQPAELTLERSPEGWWLHARTDAPDNAIAARSTSSHVLEERWTEAAREATGRIWALYAGQTVKVNGRVITIVELTRTGSIKIRPQGAGERTISLTDLGWTLCAAAQAELRGELVDLAMVNRLRYRPGTPKGSTRYIDTGWAICLVLLLGVSDADGTIDL
jgi:superfamily II DNA or RNA helicase/HKD family nuclease